MSEGLIKSARRVFDILELFRERQCPSGPKTRG
jgi:hypothetical protein